MLTDAIKLAHTEHVVYFLLTAYVETLGYFDPLRSSLPSEVKRLPITGKPDVVERLHALRGVDEAHVQEASVRAVIREAIDVLSAASQRLRILQNSGQFVENKGNAAHARRTDRTQTGAVDAQTFILAKGTNNDIESSTGQRRAE